MEKIKAISEAMSKEEIQDQIDDLELTLQSEVYWLDQTSNPMKMRRRRKTIKKLKEEIAKLNALLKNST